MFGNSGIYSSKTLKTLVVALPLYRVVSSQRPTIVLTF